MMAMTDMLEGAPKVPMRDVRLQFSVSLDKEYVRIRASYDRVSHELTQFQIPSHVLLDLARKRLADQAAGLPEDQCGWMDETEVQAAYSNVLSLEAKILRLRFLFSYLPVTDPNNVVEQHPSRARLRLGTGHLVVSGL
jgi:hypothetical protein